MLDRSCSSDDRWTGLQADRTPCLPAVPELKQRMQGLIAETTGFRDLTHPAGKAWCGNGSVSYGLDGMHAEKIQEVLWRKYFAHPTHWWDNRRSKPTPRHPDFKHKVSKLALWLSNRHKPAWVDYQLTTLDAWMKSVSTSAEGQEALAAYEGRLEVEMCLCSELCKDGRISDAVDALKLLVQRGCYVPNKLFYRVLKRCITSKDLVSGRCIHALTVKGGYEGDAFLATQLIGLYASLASLEEAKQVFNKVSAPNAYNWATIIFAYARHGGAAGAAAAIRLYRKMLESTQVKPDDRINSAVLKACATAGDLVAGKQVHAQILASSRKPDKFVQAGLVDMYAKCGSLEDARSIFDELPERNVVIWNAMFAGYAQQGLGQEALSLYSSMQEQGLIPPNSVTYVCLLQACASVGVGALHVGKQLHAQIIERELQADVVLGGSLVNMYTKCGSSEDARQLFDQLPERNVVTWNLMIAGYTQQGMGKEALSLYGSMQQYGLILPDLVTYACLLQACASVGEVALHQGKQLHAQIEKRGLQEHVVLGGSLVNMYAKCGSLADARRLFDRLQNRNVLTWTAMLTGYAQQGMGQEALSLYSSMRQEGLVPPNSVTYVCLLQACASVGVGALHEGKQLHAQIKGAGLQEDLVLGGSLVNMYAKCGSLDDARQLFDNLGERTIVAWTAMLAGYVQQGMGQEALSLYNSMQQEGLSPPNPVTYSCLLQACGIVGVGALHVGQQLHAQIKERGLENDLFLGGSLINMYAKCGSLEDARRLFDRLPERTDVTWTAMLSAYAQQGMGQEALSLYSRMRHEGLSPPDCVTFLCLLHACASVGVGALHQGKELHAQIKERGLEEDVVLGGSLVNMYVKCGCLEDARRLFDKLPKRNVVTWNAMLAGYAQQGMGAEALSLYGSMQEEDLIPPDSCTYVCLLQSCADAVALAVGKRMHAEIEERGLLGDVVVGAGLVNMYAKCGSMSDSQRVFDSLPQRGVEAWGALIDGYARQGDSDVVFSLLDMMTVEAVQPDCIAFLSVLTVCSHVGLVDKGREYFESMRTDYGISATADHFTCMMDILGRAGHLGEALEMAKTMPFPPSSAVWLTLLAACLKWNNVEIGRQAFENAVKLDGKEAAPYVMMSNIYARAEMWEEAKKMQARRKQCGAWKDPGQSSWTDMGGVVHSFVVGDKKHF